MKNCWWIFGHNWGKWVNECSFYQIRKCKKCGVKQERDY